MTISTEEIQLMYQVIGHNVKKLREQNNMSQIELSNVMGYKSVSLVASAEITYNNKHFNLEHLYKISKIFNVPFSSLFNM